jgi:NAD(P)-dependent dehydrogenase (short-subunit alcohol dehydrogenase family)
MDLQLKDKVAIIGGASKGLGRACAEVLAAGTTILVDGGLVRSVL